MTATPRLRSPVPGIVILGLGIAFSWALVGLPLIWIGAGQLIAWAHRDPVGPAAEKRALAAGGAAALILGAAVVTGSALGLAMIELAEDAIPDDDTALLATAVIAPFSAGLLFAPLAFVPSLALHGSRGAAIVESIWLAAHRGALGTTLVGLGLAAHGALPFALAWACLELVDDDLAPLALIAGIGVTVLAAPLTLSRLAEAFARARTSADDAANAERALGALAQLAIGPLAVLAIIAALAASAPLRVPAVEGWMTGERGPVHVPGTDVTVFSEWDGVHVMHADGREHVDPIDGYLWGDVLGRVERVRYGGREAWRVVFGSEGRGYQLVLDDHGERLDDGIGMRLDARTPGRALVLLALACALAVAFTVLVGRVRAKVRTLAQVIRDPGHDVITGALALRGSAPRVVSGALLGGAGAAIESEGGAIRIALPDAPVAVLATDPTLPTPLAEGTRVTLVSQGERLAGVGLRDASAPFPASGALVVGDPARGRAALVRASFPKLVWIGVAIGASVFAATLAIASATA